jgi:three-Cys-motif partner protein
MTHTFGGSWTTLKLDVMERYFSSFAMALKNMPFACWYIDAFAGTGERSDSRRGDAQAVGDLFGEEATDVLGRVIA